MVYIPGKYLGGTDALWSDDTLCTLTGSQPPVTTDKVLTVLKTKIEKGFPMTKAELEPDIQLYWRVKDMLTVYEGVIYMGDRVVVPEEQSTGYTACSTPGDHINEAEGREEPVLAKHGQGHCQQVHVLHLM